MAQYEVMFTVSQPMFGPNSATNGSSLLTNVKTMVEAAGPSQAEAMVKAQYGSGCKTFGAFKRS
jgi:hypothetical protein